MPTETKKTDEVTLDPAAFDDEFGAIQAAKDAKYSDDSPGQEGSSLDDIFGTHDPEAKAEPKTLDDAGADTDDRSTEPRDDEFDEELVERAEDVGLIADDFATPGALERIVSRLERRERVEKAEARPEDAPFEWPEIGTVTKLDIGEELGELDETAAAVLSKINEHAHSTAEAQQKTLKFLVEHNQKREAQEFQNEFDALIAALGPEWEEHYGKGASSDLSPRSKGHKNRSETWNELRSRLVASPGKSTAKSFKRSHTTINLDLIREKDKEQTRASLKKKSRKTVSRPSRRSTSTTIDEMPHGTERAKANLKRKLQDAGLGEMF